MRPTDTEENDPRETQRANILEGAKRAFARKGNTATMADVARAAGVSQGLAYRYFAGKDEIYRELVEQALEKASLEVGQPEHEQGLTPGQRLALLVTRLVEHRRDHLELFQLLDQLREADKVPGDITEQIRQRRESFYRDFRQLIVEAQATGEAAADDPDQLVIAITASLDGLARFALHNPEEFRKLCPDASILLRMLRA